MPRPVNRFAFGLSTTASLGRSASRRRHLLSRAGRADADRRPFIEKLEERRLLDALVFAGLTELTDGETIARQFGAEQFGNGARTREFEITNDGAEFTLSDLTLPEGFTLVEDFSATTVGTDETVTFSIALDTGGTIGAKSGDVTFAWDEGGDPQTFSFAVEGLITPAGGPKVVDLFTGNRGAVWATFDEALGASVVADEALRVYAAGNDGIVGSADDERVAGTLNYDADERRLSFTPDNNVDEDYRVEMVDYLLVSDTGELLNGEFAGLAPNGWSGNQEAGGYFHAAVDVSDLTDIARLQYNLGTMDITLTPGITPITVDNFYAYADSGRWDGTFMHRLVQDFVVQGGGFRVVNGAVEQIDTFDPIQNEFDGDLMSNVRGTLAMAKIGGDPDSATSQFFFNVQDNTNLDTQNEGFTVFATIRDGDGYELMDVMNALTTEDATSENPALGELPVLDNYDGTPLENDELLLLRRASGEARHSAVNFTALVLDISGAEPDPPGGAHFNYDFGTLAQDAQDPIVQLQLGVLNSGATAMTVTAVFLDSGAKYSVAPVNNAGNSGDDWQIANGDSFNANLFLNIGQIGTFEDTLTLRFAQAGEVREYIVDVSAEVVPGTPAQPDLAAAYDTGSSNADNITRFDNSTPGNALVFRVDNVQAGATVTLYADDDAIGSAVVPDGDNSLFMFTDGESGLLDGEVVITVVQTVAGVDSLASAPLTVTIDTATPVFDPVDDQSLTLGEQLALDIQTDEESAGGVVLYELLDGPAGATLDPQTGALSWQTTVDDLGAHDFLIQAEDLAGNQRTLAFTVSVTPEAPAEPDLANWTDTGDSQLDDLTKNNNASVDTRLQFVVDGVEEGALVTIYAGDVAVGTATVPAGDASVRVTTDGSTVIEDGEVAFTATQTLLGVESAPSAALLVTIDATGPVFEEIPPQDLNASVNQQWQLDLDTDDEQAVESTVVYELVTAPAEMDFNETIAQLTWTPTLADAGPHDVVVTATDEAGNTTTLEIEVVVAGPPPGAAPDLLAGFDTGNSDTDNVTSRNNASPETTLSFRVTEAVQGSTVRIYGNGMLLGSAVVPLGESEVVVTTDGVTTLEDGTIRITATQETANGESDDSQALLLTVDTEGPVFEEIDPDLLAYVGFNFILDLETDEESANRFVRYGAVERPTGSNLNPTNGRVVWTPTEAQVGMHTFVVNAEDDAGNTSEFSFDVEVVSPSLPAEGAEFESALTEPGRRRINLVSEATTQYMVLLSEPQDGEEFWLRIIDDDTLELLDADRTTDEHPAAITFEAQAGGRYRLEVQSYNDSTGSFTVSVVPDPDGRPEEANDIELIGLDRYDGKDILLGQYNSKILDERVDRDYVSFVASTTGDADITVYAADGLEAAFQLYDGTDIDNLVLVGSAQSPTPDESAVLTTSLTDGVRYFVRVNSEEEGTTGRYSVRVAAAADFNENFPIEKGTLEENLSLEGTIFPDPDQDWFSFVADRDGPVLFGSTGSFTLSLRTTITDTDTGEQVAQAREQDRIQPWGRFDAVAGRTYLVKLDSIADTWGDYTMIFAYDEYGDADNALPLDLQATPVGSETDGLIAEVEDGIDSLGEEDWFTFQAPLEGGRANMSLSTTPGLLAAHLTIFTQDPGGALDNERVVRDEDATGGFSFDEELNPGATYFLRIKRLEDSFLNDYTLRIAIDGNSTPAAADDLGELTITPTPVVGETSSLDDLDYFRFTSSITGAVILELDQAGPDQKISIYNADTGTRIDKAKPKKNRPAQIRFDALASAEYLLLVEPHKKQIGDYTVTMMVDDIGLPAQATDLVFEQRQLGAETDPLLASVDGELSINLDEDWYTFIAPTGADTAYFAMDGPVGVLFPELTVYSRNPSGGLRKLDRDKDKDGDGRAETRVDLIEGAQYWVHAASIKGRSAGEYTIRAEIDYNNTFATADDLGTLTERLDADGFALDNKDTDIYRVTVDRDGLLHLAFDGGPLLKARVRLYSTDNTNHRLEQGTFNPGDPPLALSHAVTAGQSFFVEIEPKGKNSAGAYTLSLDYDPIIF